MEVIQQSVGGKVDDPSGGHLPDDRGFGGLRSGDGLGVQQGDNGDRFLFRSGQVGELLRRVANCEADFGQGGVADDEGLGAVGRDSRFERLPMLLLSQLQDLDGRGSENGVFLDQISIRCWLLASWRAGKGTRIEWALGNEDHPFVGISWKEIGDRIDQQFVQLLKFIRRSLGLVEAEGLECEISSGSKLKPERIREFPTARGEFVITLSFPAQAGYAVDR